MPIKSENRARYPKDWKAISQAAKERAGFKCQHAGCKARQYSVGRWLANSAGLMTWKAHADYAGTYAEARQFAAEYSFALFGDGPADKSPVIVIVLTVAHLNHQPEDCRPENLAALCQRHHLALDAKHHRSTAYRTRKDKACTGDMFAERNATP